MDTVIINFIVIIANIFCIFSKKPRKNLVMQRVVNIF